MSNVVKNSGPLHTLMKAMVAGLPKLPSTLTGVSVLNQTYTLSGLATQIATYEAPYAAAEAADLAKHTADAARDAIASDAHAFVMASVTALKAALGRTSATLETVGITPDKVPAPLTVQQKVAKAAKGNATRKARGTMGKKQKTISDFRTLLPAIALPRIALQAVA